MEYELLCLVYDDCERCDQRIDREHGSGLHGGSNGDLYQRCMVDTNGHVFYGILPDPNIDMEYELLCLVYDDCERCDQRIDREHGSGLHGSGNGDLYGRYVGHANRHLYACGLYDDHIELER
jgi:hypothetical protein